MDKIRNEYIRGTAQVGRFGEKTREVRVRWYGHVRRKHDLYNCQKIKNGEGLKGGLWMLWERTWQWLK